MQGTSTISGTTESVPARCTCCLRLHSCGMTTPSCSGLHPGRNSDETTPESSDTSWSMFISMGTLRILCVPAARCSMRAKSSRVVLHAYRRFTHGRTRAHRWESICAIHGPNRLRSRPPAESRSSKERLRAMIIRRWRFGRWESASFESQFRIFSMRACVNGCESCARSVTSFWCIATTCRRTTFSDSLTNRTDW